jgi:DNA primase
LTNLVNKYKSDPVSKDEKRTAAEEKNDEVNVADESNFLLSQDEAQEKNVLRVLLEYGLNDWDEHTKIADHIFEELEQYDFENPELIKLYEIYKTQYQHGLEPNAKALLYYDDAAIRTLVVNITMFPYELSRRWDEVLENMQIITRDVSKQDVITSLSYFKLRKIKKMFDQNQLDMEQAKTFEEQMRLVELHKHLKEIEVQLVKELGTVILK